MPVPWSVTCPEDMPKPPYRPRTRTAPVPGHKRARVVRGVRVTCECGWESNTYYGAGALKEAHGEWRWHADVCAVRAEEKARAVHEMCSDCDAQIEVHRSGGEHCVCGLGWADGKCESAWGATHKAEGR